MHNTRRFITRKNKEQCYTGEYVGGAFFPATPAAGSGGGGYAGWGVYANVALGL